MWTGSGYVSVNPKYVDEYKKKGYTTDLPSQAERDNLIKNPVSKGQSYNPITQTVDTVATPRQVKEANKTSIVYDPVNSSIQPNSGIVATQTANHYPRFTKHNHTGIHETRTDPTRLYKRFT